MLLQTNSYIVPKDKRSEHQRLMRRFRQALARVGCDHFEVYEQVGPNWGPVKGGGRFVQILRFRDRKHQIAIQQAEKNDPAVQQVIAEFCELVNLPYQQEKGLFALGYYIGVVTCEPEGVWREAQKQGAEPEAPAGGFGSRVGGEPELPAAVHDRTPLEEEGSPVEHQGNGPNGPGPEGDR